MQSNSPQREVSNKQEIDWHSFFLIIWDYKKIILLVSSSITLIAVAISFYTPNQYTASVLLKLSEDQATTTQSSFGGASGLASIAGISLAGTNNSAHYATAILGSKKFLSHIANFPGIRENLTAARGFNFQQERILYKEDIYDGEKKKWVQVDANGSPIIPSDLDVIAEIKNRMNVYVDFETNFITITFQHYSPFFAFEFINLVEKQLNVIEREKDIRDSSLAIAYLNEQLEETRQTGIQNAIYQIIESQLKTQMLANIDEHYLVTPIDPAVIPEQKSFPFRRNIVLVAFFLSLLSSCIFVLLRYFYMRPQS